ncbi:diguanylate cyclase [Paenibacillus allorhizosphaerae]|uniref:GGDEF domain-containing protein n=1 Tax=Paenibacillus allorhizosphaerae TaxID=2849866 RepID=A0ABN7TU53_9BACL|nr:GGDEF domain-containing protein [Paenibacillus allorhizosphaerae]CAG7649412.1 hypothetical protein PAECIP111802_04483 [Paenibacillus allorhizosphaerae]
MYYIPLTNACTLIALSYMALKLRNLPFFERFEALMAPVLTGMASIILMLLPFPDDSLLSDLRYAPLIMAGLRFGWTSALPSTLLPAVFMTCLQPPDLLLHIGEDLLLPAVISSLFHRKEYDTGYSVIRFTDGWSICAILAVCRLIVHGQFFYVPGFYFWGAHLFMLFLSGVAITVLIYMYNEDNRIWMVQRKLELEAKQDGLTRLPNLRGFLDIAGRTMKGRLIAILMIDIDNFKRYNDSFGHLHGDQLLRDTGQILRSVIHEQDYVARYGGEEFIVLSHLADEAVLARYADHLCRTIEAYEFYGDDIIQTTISVGISVSQTPQDELQKLIDEADRALYHSKLSGKNRYTFYSPHMSERQKNA